MVQKNELYATLENLLVDAYHQYVPCGKHVPKFIVKMNPLRSYGEQFQCDRPDLLSCCAKLLSSYTKLLQSDNVNVLLALTSAGAMNMNPALLAVQVSDQTVTVLSVAKEGLVDQKTAQMAVTYFKTLLLQQT